MKKLTILCVCLLALMAAFSASALADEGDSLWLHTYGGTHIEYAHSIIPAGDGGFMLSGVTHSFGAGGYDGWLVKVNANGDSLWSRTYGGSFWDMTFSIIPAGDGNFLMVGYTENFGGGVQDTSDAWLLKLNAQGDTLWTRTYGGPSIDRFWKIIPAGDGNFLLVGTTMSFGAGDYDYWLLKVNAQGDSLWSRTYGGSGCDELNAIIPSGDGGFLLAGRTSSFGAGDYDWWLLKVNPQGDSLWSRTYGGSGYESAWAITPSGDGGFLLAGRTTSYGAGSQDVWLVKVNTQGDPLWSRTYGGSLDDAAASIIPVDNGFFLVAAFTYSFGAGFSDTWLLKVNAQGDTLWSRTYGSAGYDATIAIIPSGDGNFLLAGHAGFFDPTWFDMALLKVEGAAPPTLSVSLTPINPPITIPAAGGSFNYTIAAQNLLTTPQTFDAWVNVQVPGNYQFTTLGPVSLTLPGGGSVSRTRTQNVPANAPAGVYVYKAMVGEFPWIIMDADSFNFSKMGANDDWLGPEEWSCTGESLPGEEAVSRPPSAYSLSPCQPNPFNPSTAIRYQMPDAGYVNLKVYDVAGRLVTTLVDGWREAGSHEVTCDGSNLSTGIYLLKMRAGDFSAMQKMVLVK